MKHQCSMKSRHLLASIKCTIWLLSMCEQHCETRELKYSYKANLVRQSQNKTSSNENLVTQNTLTVDTHIAYISWLIQQQKWCNITTQPLHTLCSVLCITMQATMCHRVPRHTAKLPCANYLMSRCRTITPQYIIHILWSRFRTKYTQIQ